MKKYIYTFIIVLFTISCSNDDDCPTNNDPTIKGTWSLVNISGGFAGVDQDFEAGIITWKFNIQAQELTITNTNTDAVFDGYPSGVYDFEIITTEDSFTIVVEDNIDLEVETLTNNQLVLDESIASDGFLYTFVK